MLATLIQAINNRRILRLNYDGGYRMVEPHAYGHNAKTGHDLIRAFQVSGSSKSFEYVGWKLFDWSDIRSIEVLDSTFAGARQGYKRNDKAMDEIYCQL